MKKNILIISYAYPPINVVGALRAHAISKNLDIEKYNITVITCNLSKVAEGVESKRNIVSYDNGIKLIRIGNYIGGDTSQHGDKNINGLNFKSSIKSFVRKFYKYLIYPDKGMFWYHSVISYLRKNKYILESTHIVLSTSPLVTTHNIARYIKTKNPKVKWVADFRDFYYLNNIENSKSLKSRFHKSLEAKFIKDANGLVFITETMLENYQKRYIDYKDKMKCIYNGLDSDDISCSSGQLLEDKLSLFYAGSFYNGLRSPLTLMQLLDRAFEEKLLTKEEVVIRIAGNIDDEIKASIEKYKSSSCVEYLGLISRTDALSYMYNSIFLWLIVANLKSHYQTVPAKLFEYIAARRPVINFAPKISESSKIIHNNNLGYNFDTLDFNMDESYVTFQSLIKAYKVGDFNQPLSKDILNMYSWENNILLFEDLFESL